MTTKSHVDDCDDEWEPRSKQARTQQWSVVYKLRVLLLDMQEGHLCSLDCGPPILPKIHEEA